jgi:non-specific serine/threonine protein kinase
MSECQRSHNLPAPLTSFVGREREVAEVCHLLERSRLVTLSGAGGVGKTRLALQIGASQTVTCPDGVWFVELGPLGDAALIPQAVASAVGVREEAGRGLTATLADFFRPRKLLLILDNCEHLVAACAAFADKLLRACSGLTILATSREPLGVGGETVRRVPSLSVPEAGQVGGDTAAIMEHEATRLFVERASAVRDDFGVTDQVAPAIAQICARLDGIPLAIELAAARVTVLAPEQIAARLDDRFRLLTGGGRTVLPRQQTLRATVDWSHDLLAVPERTLLRRLAVFAGGWTLDAAEAICAGGGINAAEVLDHQARLVDKSLVLVEASGAEARYRLLETIRAYGLEQLAAGGETVGTRRRHAGYFLALAEQAELAFESAGQGKWLTKLEQEHDNLRAALTWGLTESAATELGLRLAGTLSYFWFLHGHYSEGRRWLQEALARSRGASALARANALFGAGHLARWQDDYRGAEPLLEQALALYRVLGDDRGIARTLLSLAIICIHQGVFERAAPMLEESLGLSRAIGDAYHVARSLNNLGFAALEQGDFERATVFLEEGLGVSRALGDETGAAIRLAHLGEVMRARREHERARVLLEESAAIAQRHRFADGAMRAFQRLGLLAYDRGDFVRARACLAESSANAQRVGNRLGTAEVLEGFAALGARLGEPDVAARLFGAADAIRQAIGAPLPPYQRADHDGAIAALRARLGDERFSSAWADGRATPLERAVEQALAIGAPAAAVGSATDERSHGDPTSPLSPREREVAARLGRGLTNRQIAAELVISERTVETHVRSILSKLGCSSRAQVAVWTAERGVR